MGGVRRARGRERARDRREGGAGGGGGCRRGAGAAEGVEGGSVVCVLWSGRMLGGEERLRVGKFALETGQRIANRAQVYKRGGRAGRRHEALRGMEGGVGREMAQFGGVGNAV